MQLVLHPEVLSPDWIPPVAFDRSVEVAAVAQAVRAALEGTDRPVIQVLGPSGAGTSTVARLGVRTAVDELRHLGRSAAPSQVVTVHARRVGRLHGIATEMLRSRDPGFSGRGFPAVEIIAGFLRRLRRDGRPAVVVVDDIGAGTGDLSALVRAVCAPDRFLPEGESGIPPLALVLAGSSEARAAWNTMARVSARTARVDVGGLEPATLGRLLVDRAQRALGREPPTVWIQALVARALEHPRGARVALELLHRELGLGAPARGAPPAFGMGRDPRRPFALEAPLVDALLELRGRGGVPIGRIRERVAELARARGGSPPAITTFWRRIVRLEAVGLVHREVRTGGRGGSSSLLEVSGEITSLRAPGTPGTPRDAAPPSGTFASADRSSPLWAAALAPLP